jgi:CHAT domain-containing protein
MVQFYENLWDKRMGKLEALRAAQLSMLREARRGGEDEFADSDGPTDGVFRAPEFWAAWVLSGDWR